MSQEQKEYQLIRNLEKVIKTAHKNPMCLYSPCQKKPIGSHIIARKTLEFIAEKSHILTWPEISTWDMKTKLMAGRSLDELYENPVLIGIRDTKVTLPLFCENHDYQIFAPLEVNEFSFQPEQVMLLAYRTLCSMTLGVSRTTRVLSVAKQYGYNHSLSETERFQRLQRFQMTNLMINVRQHYEQIHINHDYDQLGWSVYLVGIQPCVAATYTLIPVDDNDALAIINGSQTVAIEDAISFSFLPYPPLNSSVCVISWIKGSQRAQRFMMLNGVNEISENERKDLFLHLAFESPTLYISPQWWRSLSDNKIKEYKGIHLHTGREHAKLV